jgi:Sulfatase
MTARSLTWRGLCALAAGLFLAAAAVPSPVQAQAPAPKPNIVLIVSDDFGYGDASACGGGEGRGMPTPQLDRLADEGMTLFSFYAQPSCTPGRAAIQTGRIPNDVGVDPAGNVWVADNWQDDQSCFGLQAEAKSTLCGGNGLTVFYGMAKPVRAPQIGPAQQP